MRITIDYPYMLLLLVPAVAACIYFAGRLRIKDVLRKRAMIAMRIVIISLVIFAMAGISLTLKQRSIATIFLVDLSESATVHTREMADFVREAVKELPEGEMAGVVAFGYDSAVESFVKEEQAFSDFQTNPISTATNIEQAVTTAMTLYPEGSGKRLVLLTDGQENAGDVQNMVPTIRTNSVVFEVKRLASGVQKEVYVSDVSLPEKIHTGDSFTVKVEVESTVETDAVLSLYAGKTLKGREKISLQKGSNQFVFKDERNEEGFLSYRAVISANQDSMDLNNEYVAYTQASEGREILLVEGRENNAKHFEPVLKAANVDYDKVKLSWVPDKMAELNEYKSIILVDVHVDDLPEGFMKNLEAYVGDYGGGLIAIGGENSFALGGYRNTALEKVLPVNVDLTGEKEVPKMAVVMVIDHSGSMSGNMGGYSKLELAKESAARAMKNLRDTDEAGILSFDDKYHWASKLSELSDREQLEEDILSIKEGGGTSIYPAVAEAKKALEKSDANTKHIILLTDGQDTYRNYSTLMKEMRDEKITLSSVAVGSDSDTALMKDLAEAGEGRYYYTDGESDMPRIFAREIFMSAKGYLVNREFTPVVKKDNGILTEVIGEGLPKLKGYIGSSKKNLATSLLVSDEEDPILTCWQYGLGKTAAFNSDVENIWTADFAAWDKYPLFWRNIIDWTITDLEESGSTLEIEQEGQAAKLRYTSKDYKEDTKVTILSTDEEGQGKSYDMTASAPGVYEAELDFAEPGVYSIHAEETAGGETKAVKNSAVAVQYSTEYRISEDTQGFDNFLEQAGAVEVGAAKDVYKHKPERVSAARNLNSILLLLALVLFAWDVTARRLSLSLAVFCRDRWLAHKVHTGQKREKKNRKGAETGKGSKKAQPVSEEAGKGSGKAQPYSEETGKGSKKAQPSGEETGKEGGKTQPYSEEAGKGSGKAQPVSEEAEKGSKKAQPVSAERSKGSGTPRPEGKKKENGEERLLDTSALLKKKQERRKEF